MLRACGASARVGRGRNAKVKGSVGQACRTARRSRPPIDGAQLPPPAEPAYLPGCAYDEMYARRRRGAAALRAAAGAACRRCRPRELGERQRTQERSFLLQGITFTVYGADSATERIIPTDLLPAHHPGARVGRRSKRGLTQRLQALNMFLADIYGDAADPDGRGGAARPGAAAPQLPARDAAPLCAARRLRQRLRLAT